MALLGFPEEFGQFELKHYLRLLVIILGYIVIRPHLVKIGERIQNKQHISLREQAEAAKARDEKELEERVAAEAAERQALLGNNAKSSGAEKGWNTAKVKNRKNKSDPLADMPEDEDISDLLG